LKRFEYDPYRDDLAKINDRFEFPTELDMSPWLSAPSSPANNVDVAGSVSAPPQQRSQRYHLSAVVMHVGGPSAGHYYAYNAAKQDDAKWVKLDDQRVTEVSEAEVLRDAFGWSGGAYSGPGASGAA
ncbi:unnamed protein product, partial [Laminaria digitata]